ncbi:IucA/IucC family protein [Parendozoicomonas sp. Alg238-R29]|uniref:IucA/IucC family protein n=1 Tax=Parendozoicomonas sp. Alg238-R29 TaxID=2993446 RepID=UPI00248E6715|nr:IucA/IucC family protein [Parendozoicomonas sp. Alg238-R29]
MPVQIDAKNTLVVPPSSNPEIWEQANRKLLAKSIGELCWEELFSPTILSDNRWQLKLKSGASYHFRAWRNIWDQPVVEPSSIERSPTLAQSCVRQFYIDASEELETSPATLSNLLEELANTLMADAQVLAKQNLTASELVQLPDDSLQAFLDGHPKIAANKGRMGWGFEDHQHFSTESSSGIQLVWLALDRNHCQLALSPDFEESALLSTVLNESEQTRIKQVLAREDIYRNRYLLLPVHPWQWFNKLTAHFATELANRNIVYLGPFGDLMQPLQSLRTLANTERPEQPHIKLPLTILNTSCYRGIPGRYITAGPVVSKWLADIAASDEILSQRRAIILQEPAGAFYPHPLYEQIENSPYRFQEMLGCIWRESVVSHLQDDERSLLVSALFQKDGNGNPLICEYIHLSGLSTEEWLEKLFDAVVVPLYHLQCRYGVGLVAHGQNITLVLKNWIPARVALKDFQGDLRLTETDYPEQEGLPADVKNTLGKLPEKYLIHDLLTGHFVTVLRFVSTVLAEQNFSESRFYGILSSVLQQYMTSTPELKERHALFNLFTPKIERICLHRVRFKQGYDDSAERPLPALGTPLNNPLYTSLEKNNDTL